MAKKAKQEQASAVSQDAAKVPSYSKAQYLASKRLTPAQKDMLSVVLDDSKRYTEEEMNETLNQFMKRSV